MSILETMRSWLSECPYLDEFSGGHIDWTDNTAMEYGIMPTGSVTIRTEEDVEHYLGLTTLALVPERNSAGKTAAKKGKTREKAKRGNQS